MERRVKDPALSCSGLGGFCGMGLIPDLGTSICQGHIQKKKKVEGLGILKQSTQETVVHDLLWMYLKEKNWQEVREAG